MNHIASTQNKNFIDQPTVVCIVGTLRTNDFTYQNLIEKLIKPLNADLMFCVTRMSAEDEAFISNFKGCNIIDLCIYEDGKVDGYENLLNNLTNQLSSEARSRWHEYFNIEGNWLGGMKGRRGSGLHLTFNCWKLLERLQYLKTKGFDYQRFVISRTDLFWLVKHPPLNLLDPQFIWIPTGEDYNGYNDRHAICSKQNISYYLNMFECMANLNALNYIYNEIDDSNLNHERHLKSHLDYYGIKTARFKNVAYLTENKQNLTNWGTIKSKFVDGQEYIYKYEGELLSALRHLEEFNACNDWKKFVKI